MNGPRPEHAPRALVVLAVGVAARVLCLLVLSPYDRFTGGDGPWYARQAWLMLHAGLPAPLTTVGPLYPLLLAGVWLWFPDVADPARAELVPAAYLTAVRTMQIAFGAVTAWAGWRLARHLTGDDRAALVTVTGLGLGPAFVMEPFQVLTESLFMVLLTLAILCYVSAQRTPAAVTMAATGTLFGLATLTRPVLWPFPALIAAHLSMRHGARAGARLAAVLLGSYLVVLAPWHAYLQSSTGRPMPEGLSANLWIGAVGEGRWTGKEALDEARRRFNGGVDDYTSEALAIIRSNPLRWAWLRGRRLAESILQPHGTVDVSGPPVKASIASIARGEAPAITLWSLVSRGSFWLKASVYVFHYAALLLGVAGLWLVRRRWRDWFALYAVVACLCAVYGLLTVLPRYLFPAEVFLWIFAGAAIAQTRERRRRS